MRILSGLTILSDFIVSKMPIQSKITELLLEDTILDLLDYFAWCADIILLEVLELQITFRLFTERKVF